MISSPFEELSSSSGQLRCLRKKIYHIIQLIHYDYRFFFQENLAFAKPTKQSSTSHGGVSSRAVDGNSNTNYFAGSCTHTNGIYSQHEHWWRVDLGQVEPVTEVYIVNRGDCCGERLKNFDVRVGMLHV